MLYARSWPVKSAATNRLMVWRAHRPGRAREMSRDLKGRQVRVQRGRDRRMIGTVSRPMVLGDLEIVARRSGSAIDTCPCPLTEYSGRSGGRTGIRLASTSSDNVELM